MVSEGAMDDEWKEGKEGACPMVLPIGFLG
jgi:hypothetical protein